MLFSCHKEVEKILTDLWDAGIQYGIADLSNEITESQVNGTEQGESANSNSNNNRAVSGRSSGKRRSVPFVRSVSQLTRPRLKPSLQMTKRSVSSDGLSVTIL